MLARCNKPYLVFLFLFDDVDLHKPLNYFAKKFQEVMILYTLPQVNCIFYIVSNYRVTWGKMNTGEMLFYNHNKCLRHIILTCICFVNIHRRAQKITCGIYPRGPMYTLYQMMYALTSFRKGQCLILGHHTPYKAGV